MNKKQILIGLGILAVAITGVIIYKRRNKEEKKSNFKTGDVMGKDCYYNGVFSQEGCKKLGITPGANIIVVDGIQYVKARQQKATK